MADREELNITSELDEQYDNKNFNNKPAGQDSVAPIQDYVTPKYHIRHRSDKDVQDFPYDSLSNDKFASIPKELIVEIFLPLLKSSDNIDLAVGNKSLKMVSEKPSKYKLDLALPYEVLEENASATFETDNHKLVLTLPVNRTEEVNQEVSPNNDNHREDSGVENDHSPLTEVPKDKTTVEKAPLVDEITDLLESECVIESETNEPKSTFFNVDIYYSLPTYSFDMTEGDFHFTLNVRNVDPLSIVKTFNESHTSVHIKFTELSQTFFRTNYAFCIKFPDWVIDVDNVFIDRWDDNLVVEIPNNDASNQELPTAYYVGKDENSLEKMFIERSKQEQESSSDPSKESEQLNKTDTDDKRTIPNNDNPKTDVVPIAQSLQKNGRSLSASSIEYSLSRSHSCSVSESSLDGGTWLSSFEQCGTSSESIISEESEEGEEISSSMFLFNDGVSKQVSRCNSNILRRRKKIQRKSRNNERAQERRVSESETSEAEDKTNLNSGQQDKFKTKAGDHSKKQSKSDENLDLETDLIFDLDM